MASLDQVPGAGLLVTADHEILDGNDRCQIVFKTDIETVRAHSLKELCAAGVIDEATLELWERAVDSIVGGDRSVATEQIRLTPFGSEKTHHYKLQVKPVEDADSRGVYCSLRSSGTEQRYVETITALHSATRELIQAEEIEEVLHRTATAASDVLGFPGTAVRRYDPETDQLRHVAFGSRVETLSTRPPYPVDDSPHGSAFREQTTVIDDIGEADPYDREVFSQTMYIPIGEVGLLSVGTVGSQFDEVDVHFAEILGENATAAIEIVETTASLRGERERLDLLERILSRVLRHNIRNKMSIIQGNAEYLKQNVDPAHEQYVDNIIREVEQVTELGGKARQLETIVSGSFSRQILALEEEIESAVRTVSERYPGATVETPARPLPDVLAHESLDIAIENLLENACEHVEQRPKIAIDATITAETVTVQIADNGPGIPADEIEAITSRAETPLDHPSGLGLWLVEWVTERSEGEISFDVDDGTAVNLTLDRARIDDTPERSQS